MKVVNFLMALVFFGTVLPLGAGESSVTVTNVEAHQRYPWNGLVDVVVTLEGTAEDIENHVCTFAATNSATKAVIPVGHLSQNGADSGSGTHWTRKFIWDLKADVGPVKIDDLALTVDVIEYGVQLWEKGPYWARCNVGASTPEMYGYYFWWGDTVGYKREDDSWKAADGSQTVFLFDVDKCPTYGKSISQLRAEGYCNESGNLTSAYDAATAHRGAPWRMPTTEEFRALIDNCDTYWITRNGVYGCLIRGRGVYARKSIFLPAAGHAFDDSCSSGFYGEYWSSTHSSDSRDSWQLYCDPMQSFPEELRGPYLFIYSGWRFGGRPVRPLRGFSK